MDLDELKTLWNETDRRLAAMEPALRLNLRLAQVGTRDRTRSKLRFVRLVLWYEVAFGVLAVLLVGSYLFDHIGALRFALPAGGLHLCAIAILGLAVRQLVALGQIDYAGPVVEIQRRLAELRVARARSNRWLLLSSPLLWALLVIVAPHGLVGLDVYRAFGLPWVAGNFVFGLVVLGAAIWASRRFPAGSRGSTFLAWLGEDLTGRRVAAASGFLDDVVAFEAEG
jgi:hypothetical protein